MPILKPPQATISITEKTISRLVEGIGIVWCDAFGMGGERGMGQVNMPLNTTCIPLLDDEKNWTLLLEELTLLKPGCIRFLLPPDGFITKRGTMDFDSAHFDRLERLNAWASANGASIILDTLYVPRHLQVKGEKDSEPDDWALDNRAAASPAAFAGHFAGPLLDYCISERGWTQIRYYSPVNEPLYGGVFSNPKDNVFHSYAALLSALRQELIDRDLVPQRLAILGPETPSIQDWPIPEFHSVGVDPDPLLDAYSQHEYFARFDTDEPNANGMSIPMTELLNRHLVPHVNYARAKGKSLIVTELGHTYYGSGRGDPNGPSTHEAFVLDAEFVVRALPLGAGAVLRWSFLNPGDIDGRWQFIETADGSYRRVENTFYGYASIMRYVRPHSDVLDLHTESTFHPWPHIYACALRKMPQGDFSLLVVNNHPSEQVELTLKIPTAFRAKKINIIRTDRTLKHHKIGEIKRDSKTSQLSDKLPPLSLSVYTHLDYDSLERP
ncbi:MAG TPA: hypothetical protein VGP72_25150 [Planctomycetota bacterium]|jgi:hypothetical protein